jgi:FdhE protein
MTDIGAAKSGLMNIGEEAKPPFAVLPDPSTLFLVRSQRFAELAPGHKLETYLTFLSGVTRAQHEIVPQLPALTMPAADAMAQALAHGMPPLPFETLIDATAAETVRALVAALGPVVMPAEAAAAVQALRAASTETITSVMSEALGVGSTKADLPQRIFVTAGLQVHAARLAAKLDADALKPISDGVCPACGSPPVASSVVGWPKANNSRFCTCSLCSTHWNVVRVKCALCSETGGIAYHTIDGQSDTVKAETCDKGRHYLKIAYQINEPKLEPFADDVATVGLDMLMREEGWTRSGRNLFLLGY